MYRAVVSTKLSGGVGTYPGEVLALTLEVASPAITPTRHCARAAAGVGSCMRLLLNLETMARVAAIMTACAHQQVRALPHASGCGPGLGGWRGGARRCDGGLVGGQDHGDRLRPATGGSALGWGCLK